MGVFQETWVGGNSFLTISWPWAIPGSSQAGDMVSFRPASVCPLKVWSVAQGLRPWKRSKVLCGLMLC